MKNYILLLISIFFLSCQKKENKIDSVSVSDSILLKKNALENKIENKEENKQIGDTIFMNFKNSKNSFLAEGLIDSLHSKVYVKFINETPSELNATIVPITGKGNIRFNQIVFPDKTADGPFGTDLHLDLKQTGNYILIIGHSQMADSPYFGKFTVQLDIKEKQK